MVGDAAGEAIGLVEALLLAGARHQLVLDDILQKHAPAIQRRKAPQPGADFRGGEIEIGLLDVDAVHPRDDRIFGLRR